MDESGDHEYICSFIPGFYQEKYLQGELTDVVRGFSTETAAEVAGIIRNIEDSHLPLTPDMLVACIIGGP